MPHAIRNASTMPDLHYLQDRNRAAPIRVLMVCMGNICRSPTAHGVLERYIAQAGLQQSVEVDSAGTHAYHVGEPPDKRSQSHALLRGFDLQAQRARQVKTADLQDFDVVLVMDQPNETAVRALAQAVCEPDVQHKIMRLAAFATRHDTLEVPDPYYGGDKGFDYVLDLVEDTCQNLLEKFKACA